jgi:secondary thiamine-phosphate synthase enzyme
MVVTRTIALATRGHADMLDVTAEVAREVAGSGVTSGIVTIFAPSATSGLTTMEYESGALADLARVFDEIAPEDRDYRHDLRWGDGNGHAHVRAALLGPSLTVPLRDGQLLLGTWQRITYVDFDNRPRERELVVQVVGD